MNKGILSFYNCNKQWLYGLSKANSDLIRSLALAIIEKAELEIENMKREN